jgi:hypothetical protein
LYPAANRKKSNEEILAKGYYFFPPFVLPVKGVILFDPFPWERVKEPGERFQWNPVYWNAPVQESFAEFIHLLQVLHPDFTPYYLILGKIYMDRYVANTKIELTRFNIHWIYFISCCFALKYEGCASIVEQRSSFVNLFFLRASLSAVDDDGYKVYKKWFDILEMEFLKGINCNFSFIKFDPSGQEEQILEPTIRAIFAKYLDRPEILIDPQTAQMSKLPLVLEIPGKVTEGDSDRGFIKQEEGMYRILLPYPPQAQCSSKVVPHPPVKIRSSVDCEAAVEVKPCGHLPDTSDDLQREAGQGAEPVICTPPR